MGKIVYIMGKSSTGKDTIFRELLKENDYSLKTIVSYTTRPIRSGEQEGREYFFVDEEGFLSLKQAGKVIEDRCYPSAHGPWRYFTVDDGQFDFNNNFITIGTIESYVKLREYFGDDKLIPVLIELDDADRLQRALNREKKQKEPKFEEMCRRFLADSVDFSEENIKKAGITHRFENKDLKRCLDDIRAYIAGEMNGR